MTVGEIRTVHLTGVFEVELLELVEELLAVLLFTVF